MVTDQVIIMLSTQKNERFSFLIRKGNSHVKVKNKDSISDRMVSVKFTMSRNNKAAILGIVGLHNIEVQRANPGKSFAIS